MLDRAYGVPEFSQALRYHGDRRGYGNSRVVGTLRAHVRVIDPDPVARTRAQCDHAVT